MANITREFGRQLRWDAVGERWSATRLPTRPRRKGYEPPEVARVANSSGVVPAMGSWPERLLEVSVSLRLARVIFCFTLTGLAIGSIGEAKDVSLK